MKYLLSLFLLMPFQFCNAQETDFSEFSFNDQSRLKQLKVKCEFYYGHLSETDSSIYCINNFDKNGLLISSIKFSKKGKVLFRDSLIMNENNTPDSQIFYDKNGELLFTRKFKYDLNRINIGIQEVNKRRKILYENQFSYNNLQQCNLITQLSNNRKRFIKELIQYDSTGNEKETIQIRENGDSIFTKYYYKAIQNQTGSANKQKEGALNDRVVDRIIIVEISKKEKTSKSTVMNFVYNELSLCIERGSFINDVLSEKTSCKYQF